MEQAIQPLNPIAIDLGPIQIHWYGANYRFRRITRSYYCFKGIVSEEVLIKNYLRIMILFAVPIAIICARIYYVIFQWEYYSQNPGDIIKIWNGGIAIHGALIGSVLTAIVFAKVKKVSFWKLADIAAPSLLLGQAIGRWGNFMNQEAHGGEVTRSFLENMHLPEFIINQMYINGTYYHPTFLYESIWNIVGVIILLCLRKVNLRRGELFLTYVLWYSIGRFYIEGLRTDSLMLTESLRIAQVISIVLVVVAIALVIYRRVRGYADKRYLDA